MHHLLAVTPYRNWPEHAYLAVDFFFMLSGFVIAFAYDDRLQARMSLGRFLAVRAARLYPLILLGSALGLGWLVVRYLTIGDISALQLSAVIPFALLLLPVPRPGVAAFPVNGPLWSLFFELIANVMYAAGLYRLGRRGLLAVTITSFALYAAAAWINQTVIFGIAFSDTFPFAVPKALAPFLIGVLIYRYGLFTTTTSNRAALTSTVLLLVVLWAPVPRTGPIGVLYDIMVDVTIFPLIVMIGSCAPSGTAMIRAWALVGALSYPLYVLHQPLLNLLDHMAFPDSPDPTAMGLWAAGVAAATLTLAWIGLRYYDEPVRAWIARKWLGRGSPAPAFRAQARTEEMPAV